jgi:hypothetical protein
MRVFHLTVAAPLLAGEKRLRGPRGGEVELDNEGGWLGST